MRWYWNWIQVLKNKEVLKWYWRDIFNGILSHRYWNWYWYCKMLHHDIEIDIGIAKSFEGVLKLILVLQNALGDYWNWNWYCKMLWRAIEIVIDIAKSSSKYWCLFNIKKFSIAHPWFSLCLNQTKLRLNFQKKFPSAVSM